MQEKKAEATEAVLRPDRLPPAEVRRGRALGLTTPTPGHASLSKLVNEQAALLRWPPLPFPCNAQNSCSMGKTLWWRPCDSPKDGPRGIDILACTGEEMHAPKLQLK